MKEDLLIKVDEGNNVIGEISKSEAHMDGILHRAFSVFIFNTKGEWLLQQRALHKYHSGGLWTNACCSHPAPHQQTEEAAVARLMTEMGIKCEIKNIFNFTYKAFLDNGLIENEFDHVFVGTTDQLPNINLNEVASWRYCSFAEIEMEIRRDPASFTEWFKLAYKQVDIYQLKNSRLWL